MFFEKITEKHSDIRAEEQKIWPLDLSKKHRPNLTQLIQHMFSKKDQKQNWEICQPGQDKPSQAKPKMLRMLLFRTPMGPWLGCLDQGFPSWPWGALCALVAAKDVHQTC